MNIMINLKSDKNQKTNETRLVQILFYTFPLWFIVGNFAVSLNTLLFIVVSLFVIQRKQLTFRFNNSYWFLIAFFLYFFISTAIQFLSPGLLNEAIQTRDHYKFLANNPIIKCLFLIRFLILIFVIDTLFFNKILNLKKLFLSSLLCTCFVSFDIILQYTTGLDLFGFKSVPGWNSGPFGDEFIAGSYLKNFSFFSFFYIFDTLKSKNFNIPLLIFIIALHLIAALLAGNRMPLLLFLFGCSLIILLIRDLRFTISLGLLIFLSISFPIIEKDTYLKSRYVNALNQINIIKYIKIIKDTSTKQDTKKELNKITDPSPKEINILRTSGHSGIYKTSIAMWKEQPLFGYGLKSFRLKCDEILDRSVDPDRHCSNHPHNYYLELLTEAGLIGTSLMVIFFIILLKDSFNYLKKYYQQKNSEIILLIPVIISFFLEIWPLKSTGSFFTTWDATFFWLNTAMLIAAKAKKLP